MSKTLLLTAVALAVLAAWVRPTPQERVAPKGPADFHALVDGAKADWDASRYAACVDKLETALGLAAAQRSGSLLDAFPAPPPGYEVVPDRSRDAMRNNPFAAAMQASIGNVTTREYREEDGRGHVKVTLTADSPLIQMFNMWVANPAMLGERAELIEYGPHDAVLETQPDGRTRNLKILINDSHLCEVVATGLDEDGLFAMFDQEAVDTLANALGG